MKREWIVVAFLAAALTPAAASAQSAETAAKPAALAAGEVIKVDKEAKKITIKHGPIENLKMPPMTMVFRVKEAAMLDNLAPGTKVSFRAEEGDGGYVVTRLQVAKGK